LFDYAELFMKTVRPSRRLRTIVLSAIICLALTLSTACAQREKGAPVDHPRLTPNVVMPDVTFHSAALNREMPYRVVLPAGISAGMKLPVVDLLHGAGGSFGDWSHYSEVARFAERGLILVRPEGDDSYDTNSWERPQERYEDYIVTDLVSDVAAKCPAAVGRLNRAIVGVSMGGFGAVKLALRHPELYAFVGENSSAMDVPNRPFSLQRVQMAPSPLHLRAMARQRSVRARSVRGSG
jgi:S-formylglutathione hydrolase FrmB